ATKAGLTTAPQASVLPGSTGRATAGFIGVSLATGMSGTVGCTSGAASGMVTVGAGGLSLEGVKFGLVPARNVCACIGRSSARLRRADGSMLFPNDQGAMETTMVA